MAICGGTGAGKSLLTIIIAILFGRPLDLTKNISYIPTGNQIIQQFDQLKRQVFIIDEGARQLRSVDWQKKEQQIVNLKAMTDRFKNNVVLICMPNFTEFTKSMRLTNLQFRAVITYRNSLYARVVIQRKSRNWRNEDVWYDKEANERYLKLEKRNKNITDQDIMKIERNQPTYVMDFIIPNLEKICPDITNEYEKLKKESRTIMQEEQTKPKEHYKTKYEELLTKVSKLIVSNPIGIGKVKLTKKKIAQSLGISTVTLNKYLEEPETTKKKDSETKKNKGNLLDITDITDKPEFPEIT